MKYLEVEDVLRLHGRVVASSGGSAEILNLGMIESATAAPRAGFFGQEAYPTLVEKAAALGFFLVSNHGFADGNKRIGHIAMEAMLMLNGSEIRASDDDQEAAILRVAAGEWDRETFTDWVRRRTVSLNSERESGKL